MLDFITVYLAVIAAVLTLRWTDPLLKGLGLYVRGYRRVGRGGWIERPSFAATLRRKRRR